MANKFVFLPPQSDLFAEWIPRLLDSAPGWDIATPTTDEQALKELADADAAYGTMNPEMVAAAPNLRWLQAPAAAPNAGYYFDELIAHPTKVTNFREIYNDHISVQILTYMLNFTKHFNVYRDQQSEHKYEVLESPNHDIFLPESTVLIVGVGGIGTETARLCKAVGMTVLGIDAAPRSCDKGRLSASGRSSGCAPMGLRRAGPSAIPKRGPVGSATAMHDQETTWTILTHDLVMNAG